MPQYDFRTPRLYLDAPLGPGAAPVLDRTQANYLVNVLRLRTGDPVLLFNGRATHGREQESENPSSAAPLLRCFATDSVEKFERLGSRFLDRPTGKVELVDLGG